MVKARRRVPRGWSSFGLKLVSRKSVAVCLSDLANKSKVRVKDVCFFFLSVFLVGKSRTQKSLKG